MAVEDGSEVEIENNVEPKAKKIRPYILDNFTLVTKSDQFQRINGSTKLLHCLSGNYEGQSRELKYALKRTVRGLGSKLQDTRIGFYTALVGILKTHKNVTVEEIFELIEKELHVSSNLKSEAGDVYMGHILTCGALLRSGLYNEASDEGKVKIITTLMVASKQKTYLGLAAYMFLLDLINKITNEEFESSVWPHLKDDFNKPLSDHNLDSLFFILQLSIKFPGSLKKFLKRNLGVNKVVHEDTIHAIAEKLMAIPELNTLNHPIYELVGTQIANSNLLETFWMSGIESLLKTPNRNRELVAIKLANVIVKTADITEHDVSCIISENFLLRILDRFKTVQNIGKNNRKRKQEPVEQDRKMVINKAKELFDSLGSSFINDKIDVNLKLNILNKLIFYPGEILFPQITATSVTRTIIASLNAVGVKTIAKHFKEVLFVESKKKVVGGPERAWVNAERLQAAELLSYLVAHRAVAEETSWRTDYLKYFLQFTVFRTMDGENGDVSQTLAAAVKNCLYRSLNCKLAKLDVRNTILNELAIFIDLQLSNPDTVMKIAKSFPEDSQNSWKSMRKFTIKLEKALKKKPSKEHTVFLILSLQLGLFLFSESKNVELARSSLQELQSCYEHFIKDKKETLTNVDDTSLESPKWIEVLVEVLLSILSHECNLLRSLVSSVFHQLCDFITPSALQQIVSVLDPESNPLSKGEQGDDDEVSNDDKSSDDDDENEVDVKVNGNGDIASSSDEENESDIEMSEEDNEEIKVSDQFRLAVRKALGNAAPDTDTESVDADMIEEEEGMRIDKALGEAFKMLRRSKNKKTKGECKDDLVLIHFRIRILDLIDIYTEKGISMENCLEVLKPLLKSLEHTIKDTAQKPLEVRLRRSIKTLTHVKNFSEVDVSMSTLAKYFTSIVDKGQRSQFVYQAIGDKIAESALFIARCGQIVATHKDNCAPKKKKKHTPLVKVYGEALKSFFKNRNCLLPITLFHSTLRVHWDGKWDLLPIIAQNIFTLEVRQFRKHEGIQLLLNFYRNFNRANVTVYEEGFKTFEILLSDLTVKSLTDDDFVKSCKKDHFFVLLRRLFSAIKSLHKVTSQPEGHIEWDNVNAALSNAQKKKSIASV